MFSPQRTVAAWWNRRHKALFAADQDDSNGEAREGWALFEIEDVLRDARRRRVQAKCPTMRAA